MAVPAAPAGYVVDCPHGALVAALESAIDEVTSRIAAHGTLYDAAIAAGGRSFTGRGAAYQLRTSNGDWLVRHNRRGGMIARIMGDRYYWRGDTLLRPFEEVRVSALVRARGVATPEVIAVAVYPTGSFYRADVATRFIDNGRDMADIALGPDRPDASQREAAWLATGRALRVAFRVGLVHADLNLRNILVSDGDSPRAVLLDLDRARVLDRSVDDQRRKAMIARLHRSRRKLQRMTGHRVSDRELGAFNMGLGDA